MGKQLRNWGEGNDALSQALTWTDLVPDPNEPHRYVMDPATGQRWKRLTIEQEFVAEQIALGASHREACRNVGVKLTPESASSWVTKLLSGHAPFCNHVLTLLNERKRAQHVTLESHLTRLDDLGRRAEKEGKYSASIAAEVSRGRAAGLYAKDQAPEDKRVTDSLKKMEDRIAELLSKAQRKERDVEGQVVAEQPARSLDKKKTSD